MAARVAFAAWCIAFFLAKPQRVPKVTITKTSLTTLLVLVASLLLGCGGDKGRTTDHFVKGVELYDAAETEADMRKAIAEFDKAIDQDGEDAEAFVARGMAYDAIGKSSEAIADYEKALELDSENTDAMFNLGTALHEEEDYKKAVDLFSQVILLDDDDPDAYRNRALANMKLNNFNAAIEDLTWAIVLTPYLDPVIYRERSGVWRELSNDVQADLDDTVADASQEIEKDGGNASAFAARGRALFLLGEYPLALSDYDEAVRIDGKNAGYLASRGNTKNLLNQSDEAIADFDKAIDLDENNAAAYAGRATARQAKGEFAAAVEDLDKAIELDEKRAPAKASLAWILATCPDDKVRSGERAKKLAKEACEATNWRQWTVIDAYAAACAELGEFDEAVKQIKEAIVAAAANADVGALKARLRLYEAKKPYRTPAES